MFDLTNTVEVTVHEHKSQAQYEEFHEDYIDEHHLFRSDLSVVTGERFGVRVELGADFNFHGNTHLKAIVAIDGTAIRIVHFLEASELCSVPTVRYISRVRARTAKHKMREEERSTSISWHGLIFGQLSDLDTLAFPVTLPNGLNDVDRDTITVHLQLGTLVEGGQYRPFHHGPEAHGTKSIRLKRLNRAEPVETLTSFFPDNRQHDSTPVTFKFHYTSTEPRGKGYKLARSRPRQATTSAPAKAFKLGKRSRDEEEYDVACELYTGPKPEISFKRVKQESEEPEQSLQTGTVNPQWLNTFGAGQKVNSQWLDTFGGGRR
ncbi:hypothetical protein TI39_contig285g00004 [Zymoseptoria brevis]|uniref:Uncharacterized protein n=1 Tax=Zymoseptoria brevis TaxID=1047168 RepID=A0A0F4GZI9_9PEZI|nr:hypothetical protein TI39_contig285g00004 [Zymoseptoria brevis]